MRAKGCPNAQQAMRSLACFAGDPGSLGPPQAATTKERPALWPARTFHAVRASGPLRPRLRRRLRRTPAPQPARASGPDLPPLRGGLRLAAPLGLRSPPALSEEEAAARLRQKRQAR